MPDVVIVGGGASGLMCALTAGAMGHDVTVLEKGPKIGLKILVSGGGRCNFTNQYTDPRKQFLSQNPHFCISAMTRYEPSDFIRMVDDAGIKYHEKKLGQLFCDNSAKDIVAMLQRQCDEANVNIRVGQEVTSIVPEPDGTFTVTTNTQTYKSGKVVIASGGLSLPKIASDLALKTANRLDIKVVAPQAALVPLVWNSGDKQKYQPLSGISTEAVVTSNGVSFRENLLFTHRGLSGPAILQVSSYWRLGDPVFINLLPDLRADEWLAEERANNPQQRIAALLKGKLPNRLVDTLANDWFAGTKIGSCSPAQLDELAAHLNGWEFKPGGSEGYRTAEVTLGGIDTSEVSSKTFELKKVPGLFVIGEALDVTGWLGGYNFQWAWASGWCCAQSLW